MRSIGVVILALVASVALAARTRSSGAAEVDQDAVVALERGALDRWGKGDPNGFLETYAPEITYFDPGIERRIDGHSEMTKYLLPFTGKIKVARYEMIGTKVQRHGDVAVLTYNLRSEAVKPDGKTVTVRWNSTSVYARTGSEWKVLHSHWSLTALPCAAGIN
jgi:ketosteroid isomerase-like protein